MDVTREEKAKEIVKRLKKIWPNPRTALNYTNPLELLVATIMSAQTTDKLVNTLTPELFKKYKLAKDYAEADVGDIARLISKVNFAGNKAKNIKAAGQMMIEKYRGKVPDNMEDLDALPGVARKTANVVLGNAFKKTEGIVVDTHVMRLSTKLGLTTQKDPVKIEQDLMEIVPKEDWIDFAQLLINAGGEYYPARANDYTAGPLQGLFT